MNRAWLWVVSFVFFMLGWFNGIVVTREEVKRCFQATTPEQTMRVCPEWLARLR